MLSMAAKNGAAKVAVEMQTDRLTEIETETE